MSTDALSRSSRRSTPTIEPRLRARRIEVARDQGRKRLRRVAMVVAVLLVGAAAFAVTRSALLDVDRIEVRGAGTTEAQVRDALGISLGRPMTSVDPGAATARLEELPAIESASITRSWPSTVVVTVTPRRVVASVGSGSSAMAVAADGIAVAPLGGREDLPAIAGPAVAAGSSVGPQRQLVAGALAEVPPEVRAEIAEASIAQGQITFELVDGIEVTWGDDRQHAAKSDALLALLDQADRDTIEAIDLSVPRAATLNRNNGAGN